ncbi:hypothetical protein HK104_010445 [Borealophlyctis nickersoniae]|nr:hypothetical protein HK104_010445 [Borealophlyctis nickersoniae]
MAGGGGGSGVGGKTSGGRRHRGGKEKSSSSTIRKLRLMLIVLVLANMMVIILYVGVGALVPNNSTEITQISEAWTCFHAMLGLVFLSEFKQSMAGPRSGASSY